MENGPTHWSLSSWCLWTLKNGPNGGSIADGGGGVADGGGGDGGGDGCEV